MLRFVCFPEHSLEQKYCCRIELVAAVVVVVVAVERDNFQECTGETEILSGVVEEASYPGADSCDQENLLHSVDAVSVLGSASSPSYWAHVN